MKYKFNYMQKIMQSSLIKFII